MFSKIATWEGVGLANMKSIVHHFKCKKPRRSTRLEIKEQVETKGKIVQYGDLGYFEILPPELKTRIFQCVTIEELSMLALSSKNMRNRVEQYRCSKAGFKRFMPIAKLHLPAPLPIEDQATLLHHFLKLGLLMKRSTCLYATKERLKLIDAYLSKLYCKHSNCPDISNCMGLLCYGTFLKSVIAGWDDMECGRVFDFITNSTGVSSDIEAMLKTAPGTQANSSVELNTRLFFRRGILDFIKRRDEKTAWLSRILKPQPIIFQARLLYIIFGPASEGEIEWDEVSESTPRNAQEAQQHFGQLASALTMLYHYHSEWSEDDIISVLDELTNLPDEWVSENVAHLLTLCGDTITVRSIASKAINGRMQEVANIITSISLVCVKNHYNSSWVVFLVRKTCSLLDNPKDKLALLNNIAETFKDSIMDLHEYGESEERDADLEFLVTAQAEFMKEVLPLAFDDSLSGRKCSIG
ncbi:F-box only protein 47 [Lingula anatina]|uniref:F-box only protein 47 n=1 Tax=Lingula anatina TaxID=7574 RepID=A0A1S3HUS5_LINAN|nr:F-box only protein 47 [Lingula anatina]|eukprot:XP_013389795.1 F-box only protein 47 [Lingula anatina]